MFLHQNVRALSHIFQDTLKFRIFGKIYDLIRVIFQIVKKLKILIDIADIFIVLIAHSLKCRYAISHREMLVECLLAPI